MARDVTELDIEVTNFIWGNVRREALELWGFDSKDELLEEVVKQGMSAGPWDYWLTRKNAEYLFEEGNLHLVRVESQTDKAKLLHPAFQVTGNEVPSWS